MFDHVHQYMSDRNRLLCTTDIYSLTLFFTVEFSEEVHGVLREGWYNVNYDSKKAPTMRENPTFKSAVQGQIVLLGFDAPINVGEKYVQRLTSYLQV